MASKLQSGFVGGEFSPSLYARVTLDKFNFSARKLYNIIVHPHGGASNRSGLIYDCRSRDDDKPPILVPFSFSTTQTYQLEFGDFYMRVIKDDGLVLEASKTITGIPQVASMIINVVAHGYSVGKWVYISGIISGAGSGRDITKLNGKFFKISSIPSADSVELSTLDGDVVDATTYQAWTSGGSIAAVYEITTPYAYEDLPNIDYFQSADQMTLLCEGYQQMELTRAGHSDWSLSLLTFQTQVDAPITGPTLSGSGNISGNAGSNNCQYVYTRVVNGEESLPSPATSFSTVSDWPADAAMKISIPSQTADGLTEADAYNVYKRWTPGASAASGPFGWIGETSEDNNRVLVDWKFKPDAKNVVLQENRDPFDSAGNYPSCGAYYKQRRIFGGTENEPQTTFGTQVGCYKNMNIHRPSTDSDALVHEIAASDVNKIRYYVPLDKLVALTSGGPWIYQGDQNGVFSGATIQADKNGTDGCAKVKPVVISQSVVYCRDLAAGLVAVAYSFSDDKFAGTDLSILSTHLFENKTIVSISYQEAPNSIVWVAFSDGTMASMTYNKAHDVWAWTKGETDGDIKWFSTIKQGSESATYAVVRRYINGTWRNYIERFANRIFSDVRDGVFLDSAVSYDNPINITGASISGSGIVTIEAPGHVITRENVIEISEIRGMTQGNLLKFQAGDCLTDSIVLKKRTAPKNFCLNPINYGGTGWTLNDCTVSPGHEDPYGGNDAIKVSISGANAYISQAYESTNKVVRSASVWIKKVADGDVGYALQVTADLSGAANAPDEWTEIKLEDFATNLNDYHALYFNELGSGGASVSGNEYYIYGPKAVSSATIGDFFDDYVNGDEWGEYKDSGYLRLAKTSFSGADHLSGCSVSCLADGNPIQGIVVDENGEFILPAPAARVHIGLPYYSEIETMDLEIDQLNSYGKKKSIGNVSIKVKDTRGISVGSPDNNLYPVQERIFENLGETVPMLTKEYSVPVSGDWEKNGRVIIRQDNPLPMTILSVAPDVELSD